ncbi:MAG: hypothetical protein K8S97_15080, partial [Anaerolineae bacterium]|nr:hypothetical protein [Anaerolineae bacterium]
MTNILPSTDVRLLLTAAGTPQVLLASHDPDTIAETAVALANADGGVMVLPVLPGAAQCDVTALERVLLDVQAGCTPLVAFDLPQAITTPDGSGWAVGVARGVRVYALADGRVMVRAGKRNRALNRDEIHQLISARMAGDFEAEIVPGANPSDLDAGLLADYMLAREQRTGLDWRGDANTLLTEIGAVSSVGGVTVAGMLLLGRDPARWLPDAGARFVRLVDEHVAVDQTFDGPLLHVLAALWDTIQAQTRDGDYAPDPLREALFNALCHRDYRLRGERVTVRLHADRLEITSPGGLPGYLITTEHMLGARYSRNPRLLRVLRVWDSARGTGGVLGMLTASGLHGYRPPEIEAGAYQVLVRQFSARADSATATALSLDDAAGDLTPCQRDILTYARTQGSVTVHELRVRCSDLSAADLRDALTVLV